MATASAQAVAVVRILILRVSIYDGGGTPEVTKASYTILVLLPPHDAADGWSSHDLEIVQAVARAPHVQIQVKTAENSVEGGNSSGIKSSHLILKVRGE
uniref:histidine kinase n=1 Tax=Oryza nivara TaxID=4536 RepID=A0A0E0HNW6_ORYNI